MFEIRNLGLFTFFTKQNYQFRDFWISKNKVPPEGQTRFLPVRHEGLSLYFWVIQIITSEAFSTASAMASNVDPAAIIKSIFVHAVKERNLFHLFCI